MWGIFLFTDYRNARYYNAGGERFPGAFVAWIPSWGGLLECANAKGLCEAGRLHGLNATVVLLRCHIGRPWAKIPRAV